MKNNQKKPTFIGRLYFFVLFLYSVLYYCRFLQETKMLILQRFTTIGNAMKR